MPSRLVLTVIAAGLAANVVLAAGQQTPVFRSDVRTVPVYATVRQNGRLVPDLPREAFEIRDNGKPTPITVFSNDPQPLTVVLLADMSGSMERAFARVRDGTLKFIKALAPVDRLRIGSFGWEIAISPVLTGDHRVLERIAREELWPGGGTPMWNAMYAGMLSLEEERGRRVVLVLSDGADSGGGLSGWKGNADDVRRKALDEEFMVYAIGLFVASPELERSIGGGTPLGSDLIDLSDKTGGGHVTVSAGEDLGTTFELVAEELRHQYLLGFTPAVLDGKEHKLEVRAGAGMTVRTRKTFVATR